MTWTLFLFGLFCAFAGALIAAAIFIVFYIWYDNQQKKMIMKFLEKTIQERKEFYDQFQSTLDVFLIEEFIPAVKNAVHEARFGIPGGKSGK